MLIDSRESDFLNASARIDGICVFFASRLGHGADSSLDSVFDYLVEPPIMNKPCFFMNRLRPNHQDEVGAIVASSRSGMSVFTSIEATSAINALRELFNCISDKNFWDYIANGSRIEFQHLIDGVDPFQSVGFNEYDAVGDDSKDILKRVSGFAKSENIGFSRVRFSSEPSPVVADGYMLPYGMIRIPDSGHLRLILRETIIFDECLKDCLFKGDFQGAESYILNGGYEQLCDYALKNVFAGRLDPFVYESQFGKI